MDDRFDRMSQSLAEVRTAVETARRRIEVSKTIIKRSLERLGKPAEGDRNHPRPAR
jgi:hypothetical protein